MHPIRGGIGPHPADQEPAEPWWSRCERGEKADRSHPRAPAAPSRFQSDSAIRRRSPAPVLPACYQDVVVGLDGRLYAKRDGSSTWDIFDPLSMSNLGSVSLTGLGAAVDAGGAIFTALNATLPHTYVAFVQHLVSFLEASSRATPVPGRPPPAPRSPDEAGQLGESRAAAP